MRLLDRYLLRELLVPFGYCLGGFLIFWVSFDLFSDLEKLQSHKLKGLEIAAYYLVRTPEYLVVVLPIALLLALLYALTNHGRHHEITAIRAAGVSLWRMSLPYFAVGFMASLLLFALNEWWVPDSGERAEGIFNRHMPSLAGSGRKDTVMNLVFTNERDDRSWRVGVYDLKTAGMLNVLVHWSEEGSDRWLRADRAERTDSVWTFFNVDEFRAATGANAGPEPGLHTNVLALPEWRETPEEINSEVKISKSLSLRSSRNTSRKAELPLVDIYGYLRLHPKLKPDDRSWLYTNLHGRLAAPWTCLVVVLIALPFGAASGRRNIFVGVASSITICFAYFVVQKIGFALGVGGMVPAWLAAWFPNLAFGLTGLWMTARVR